MSYCRWSSQNWTSELYCFEGADSFVTHIAMNKIVGDVPEEPNILNTPFREWEAAHKAAMDFMETAEHHKIGLPHDGETFYDPTLEEFLARLLYLKEVGYKFPDYVIEEVKQEIAEEQDASRRNLDDDKNRWENEGGGTNGGTKELL